jgi:chemotaxis family two-component system sensor kinase Cph1
MGQESTLSLSLVHDGRLIGMITCAHRSPRRVSYVVRQGLEVLANQIALQLSSIESIAELTSRMEVSAVRNRMLGGLTNDTDIPQALLYGETTLLDFIPADGATIRLGGELTSLGTTPTVDEQRALTEKLGPLSDGLAFVTDALPLEYAELAETLPAVAGVLLVPLGGEGDYVAWFRSELVQSVAWLGDQTPGNRVTPLSPRNSFSAWTQDVTGTSRGWDGLETEAVELGRDLERTLFRRAESLLAHVALHDPLTGLPNRRLLMDRLEHALTKYARGEEVALLFVDLDGFKAVNDSLGHEAGDAVLIRTATQLLATVRVQDTVARIGGDEFVILCEDTTAEEADIVANRVLDAIRRSPVSATADAIRITASVGVTTANLSFGADDLLRQADAAMYRAKDRGRDQAAR